MAKQFSSFASTDALALAGAFNNAASNFIFIEATPSKIDTKILSPTFVAQIDNIKSRFNLDRSESSRRVYIDIFLHEALYSGGYSAILTIEEYLSANLNLIGQGYLDYIVSAIEANPQKSLIYSPSIVIEAKKDLSSVIALENFQWQLLAEVASVRQCGQKDNNQFTYGILTDGRYWAFYTVNTTINKNNALTVYRSKLLDGEREDERLLVIGALRYWLSNYGNSGGKDCMFKIS